MNVDLKEYEDLGVDLTTDRWAEGIDHHPKSRELMEHIAALDLYFEMKDKKEERKNT